MLKLRPDHIVRPGFWRQLQGKYYRVRWSYDGMDYPFEDEDVLRYQFWRSVVTIDGLDAQTEATMINHMPCEFPLPRGGTCGAPSSRLYGENPIALCKDHYEFHRCQDIADAVEAKNDARRRNRDVS